MGLLPLCHHRNSSASPFLRSPLSELLGHLPLPIGTWLPYWNVLGICDVQVGEPAATVQTWEPHLGRFGFCLRRKAWRFQTLGSRQGLPSLAADATSGLSPACDLLGLGPGQHCCPSSQSPLPISLRALSVTPAADVPILPSHPLHCTLKLYLILLQFTLQM